MPNRRRWIKRLIAILFFAWGPFWLILGLPSYLQDISDLWPKVVSDPMFAYVVIWMPMLFGMVVITMSEWDRIKKWFGMDDEKPPREMMMEEALDFLFAATGTDEKFGSKLLAILQQEARDGNITVWAKVGIFNRTTSTRFRDDEGVYESVDPNLFRTKAFGTHGRWVIGQSWIPGDIVHYDPMFNHAEIKSLSKRLTKSIPHQHLG